MQSSRNTTDHPTADQLYAALTRKLKKASANILKRKLATGEYVEYRGKVVPARIVAEAEAEEAEKSQKRSRPLTADVWVGSRKSVTATFVETSIRRPMKMHVRLAAPIRLDGSKTVPEDGQLFSYDAKSGQMLPVSGQGKAGGGFRRSRRLRSQQQFTGNVILKTK